MRILTVIFFFLFSVTCFGQNLSIDQLISIRKKSPIEVEEYLSNKGWEFNGNTKPTETTLGLMEFSYNKQSFSGSAESFLAYYYSKSENIKRLSIQVFNKEKYNEYLKRIKSLGYKLGDSKLEENKITKYYKGSSTTIRIDIKTESEFGGSSYTVYVLTFTANSDWKH